MSATEFDYIIVGAGSAGCALAGRLSEVPGVSVCLLEAGGSDHSVFVRAPFGVSVMVPRGLMNSWHYFTTPQSGLGGRLGFQPRGKVVGGSSSINAQVYTRCNRNDYDAWAAMGNPGWSYDELLPLFKRAERSHCFANDPYHGSDGPLHVSPLPSPSRANEAFRAACVEQGIPFNPDYNGASQYGVSPTQATQYKGERWNAARAYVHPHLYGDPGQPGGGLQNAAPGAPAKRPNLQLWTGSHSRRIVFEGRRAVGVEIRRNGQVQTVRARREVILSGGAFGSPQLLMLSGVGPGAHLQAHGIPIVHDLAGVGQNLQDHITSSIIYRTPIWQDTIGHSFRGAWAILKAMLEWRRSRTGWMTSCVSETQAFVSTCGNADHPDIQLAFLPVMVDNHTRTQHFGHGFTLHTTLMRPKSRGSVTLASADPHLAPLIDPRFFDHPEDMAVSIKGARIGFEVLESAAMGRYRGRPLYEVNHRDDAALEAYLRKTCDTEYHPVGTCRMGPDSDPMAVVDAQLRVRGVEGLRVVDASIMPALTSGNTNAPSMVIGEKAADLIRAGAAH